MIAGGSRTIPTNDGIRHVEGCLMLAQSGDFDFDDYAPAHRIDWRPAPTEDCPLRAAAVEAIRAELLRERRGRA
jgi:hypothetical protein